MQRDNETLGTHEKPALPYGLRNCRHYGDGWFLHEYEGNPLGLEYGQPYKTLVKHRVRVDGAGNIIWDASACSDRISDCSPEFATKLAELENAA